jgi:tetratricopeptide (TPR) repeat protein
VTDAHADHIASEFLAGIARLAQGDPNDAAHHFAATLRVAPTFFPATFYLGACYAATGQDREAILAWRSSLVTDPAAPWIFTLLSDALMRTNQIPQALAVLADAAKEFPASDDVLVRRAVAFSRAGDPKQTLTLLDPYLTRHPDDTDQLLLAMRLIYEAKSASKPIESADADRARFHKYFDAYSRANGPELAQARQWLLLIDRQ